MNGFVVGDAGDVEKQELFVERPGDLIVAEHLALEHRRPDAAADSYRDRAGEQLRLVRRTKSQNSPLGRRVVGRAVSDPACWTTAMMMEDTPALSYSAN